MGDESRAGSREGIADARAGREQSDPARVLIISSDPLSSNLAGPGIRALEIARHLAVVCSVILAAPDLATVSIPGVECTAFASGDQRAVRELVSRADVTIFQGYTLARYPALGELNCVLVVDLYDPFHLESLELGAEQDLVAARELADINVQVLKDQLRRGDFFICASERQRDFWLGALTSVGRLSPEAYASDPSFRSLIDIVPFGSDATPPVHRQRVLKGVVAGIDERDVVALWGGGVWNWLDPLTVIRAMGLVAAARPDVKLFFLGRGHPNPLVPTMAMYERAVALAKELNLHNRVVFFNEGWVPHAQRANYLLEADIGVSAHLELIEARFAFRTRLLDYIWADLPMVISAGDTLAEMVREQGLGLVVAIGDHEGFARALLAFADERDADGTRAGAFAAARADFAWGKVLRPLIDFCRRPRFAADRGFADPEVARLRNDLEAARDEARHLLSEFRQARDYAMRLEARVGELERAHEQVAASARTLDRQLRAANPIKNRLRAVLRA